MTALLDPYCSPTCGARQPVAAVSADAGATFAIVDTIAAFDRLAADWTKLHGRVGKSQQLFQDFAWNRRWLRHYLPDHDRSAGKPAFELAVVTGYSRGELVLAWPLVARRKAGLTHLTWMGEPASQYGDILLDDIPDARQILRQSWAYLTRHCRADIVTLRKVRADSRVGPFLRELGASPTCTMASPYLDLASAPDFTAYEQRYSGKTRKNRRRLSRRLAEKGRVEFTHLDPGPDASKLALRAIDMKRTWLDHHDVVWSSLRDDRLKGFFADVTGIGGHAPKPRVSALLLDGEPIATMIMLINRGRVAGHVFAYDLAHEKAGAGILLLEECIRASIADGHAIFDLMSPADSYKLDWADGAVETQDWAAALTVAGRIYRSVYLDTLRALLKKLSDAAPTPLRRALRMGLAGRSCARKMRTRMFT